MNYDSYKEWAICACNGIIDNCNRMTSGNYMHNINAVKMTAKMIRDNCLPHLFETPQSPWISAEERLPEVNQQVYAAIPNLCGTEYATLEYLGDNRWRQDTTEYTYEFSEGVTYWMPIPELPKEDRK